MTYAKAKLRVWNPEAYTPQEVRRAAIYILSQMHARQEDIDQATLLL